MDNTTVACFFLIHSVHVGIFVDKFNEF